MIDKINDDIKSINENFDILPKKTKKNKEKYMEYIDDNIDKFEGLLGDATREIKRRVKAIEDKYTKEEYEFVDTELKYNYAKLADKRVLTSERLNLEYLFYNIDYSNGDLEEVNKHLTTIIDNFKSVGIILTVDDFNITDNVNLYIKTFLTDRENIQDVFNEIYFKTPDIIKQIELNIKYLFYKNKKQIEKYLDEKYGKYKFSILIKDHKDKLAINEDIRHNNLRYLYDVFYSKEYNCDDFINKGRMEELRSILMDKESDRNYENLTKLKKSLLEYKVYKEYEYIVKDMKELFTHKEEYKDIMANKLKEIAAKEKELFAINKKINSEGIYKIKFLTLKKDKLADAKLERNKIITELIGLYDELDNEKIKEFIYRNVDSETNCYDLLKFATFNYNYFVSLLKKDNPDIGLDEIKDKMLKLQMFIYDNTLDIINNINVTEEKEIDKIICEKFKLNNINIEPEKLEEDLIDKTIEDVDMLLVSYDVERVGLDLNDIKFHIEADDTLK